MRPYILSECNYKDLKDREIDLVILPWGATEAHNLHLPYSSDTIGAANVAETSAEKAYNKGANVLVLPAVPFGVNTGQLDVKLDLNINPSTQMAILNDIINVLNYQKIYKLLVLNGHGGNNFKQILRELGAKYPKMFLCSCDWFTVINNSDHFECQGDHADEMETSVIMHLASHLVLPIEEAGPGIERKIKITGIREGWAWTERKWKDVTYDTGIGNPEMASKEKGEKYFTELTDKISQLLIDISNANLDELYE